MTQAQQPASAAATAAVDSMIGSDGEALDNDSLDAYSDDGAIADDGAAPQASTGSDGPEKLADDGDDDNDDASSLSSPPPSSTDEAMPDSPPPAATEMAASSPSVSEAAPQPDTSAAPAAQAASSVSSSSISSPGEISSLDADADTDVVMAASQEASPEPSAVAEVAEAAEFAPAASAKPVPDAASEAADPAATNPAPLPESPTPATAATAEAENSEPGIDIDKMLDAISADTAPEPAVQPKSMLSSASIDSTASTGASGTHSLPNPPSGAARMAPGYTLLHAGSPSAPAVLENASALYFVDAGAPGTSGGVSVLGSPPSITAAAFTARAQPTPSQLPAHPRAQQQQQQQSNQDKAALERAYQAFLVEERRYTADGKWEKFPEGSRMFIGNLSQERVSKKDVFEAFHKYGRLAQIAIKTAYGFVQYHTAAEAQDAILHLQDTEIRGRKIHLELSRPQKKERERGGRGERERERERSPERAKGNKGGRGGDRYDGRENGSGRRGRDDYRPGGRDGRGESPSRRERGRDRDDTYGRDRADRDSYTRPSRDRSRSPHRQGSKQYRSRRSPSPSFGRGRNEGGHEAYRSRRGADVPDVQFLVTQGLDRDFIKWVQAAFNERGLKTDIMLITAIGPPRDIIIQNQVLEGVIAVVDLDSNAQAASKIPLQVFDRSAGSSNVRFDGYRDLAPPVAADVVLRAKNMAATQRYGYQPQPPTAYGQPQYAGTPVGPTASMPAAQPSAAAPAYDLAALVGQLDSSTLSQLLGVLQTPQASVPAMAVPTSAAPAMPSGYQQMPPQYAAQTNPAQLNLNAILGNLGASMAPAAPSMQSAPTYGGASNYSSAPSSAPVASYPAMQQGTNDSTIQAIMAQLAKHGR